MGLKVQITYINPDVSKGKRVEVWNTSSIANIKADKARVKYQENLEFHNSMKDQFHYCL